MDLVLERGARFDLAGPVRCERGLDRDRFVTRGRQMALAPDEQLRHGGEIEGI
jgi:hypothetical protein